MLKNTIHQVLYRFFILFNLQYIFVKMLQNIIFFTQIQAKI